MAGVIWRERCLAVPKISSVRRVRAALACGALGALLLLAAGPATAA